MPEEDMLAPTARSAPLSPLPRAARTSARRVDAGWAAWGGRPVPTRALLLALTLAACGASGPAGSAFDVGPVTDAEPRDASSPDALAPDLGGRPPGAACPSTEACAAGRCVHGVCSLDCVGDAACPDTQHCVERGGFRLCTPTCDADTPCSLEQLCVADAPGRGFCVARGAGAPGASCSGPEDCASWFCAQGTCLADCAAAADCDPGTRCLALHVGGVCAETGAGASEALCTRGVDCVSGVCRGGGCADTCDATVGPDPCENDRHCVAYASLALCERGCAGPADCGSPGLCLSGPEGRLCRTRGTLGAGEPCDDPADCQSGHCTLGVCAADCKDGCPAATACVHDIAGAACRAAGAQADNSPCARGEECRSGFCAAGRCGRDCALGSECPVGLTCVAFAEGRFCFPACGDDLDCESTAWCARDLAEVPVCFWRGASVEGAACLRDFECVSGMCRGGECLGACADGRCPADQLCRGFPHGAFCTHLPAPRGAECYADVECAAELECTAGRCLPACDGGRCPDEATCPPDSVRCAPDCDRDADCAPGFVCQRHDGTAPYCAPRGELPLHGPCARGPECRSGLCHGGRCTADCPACNVGSGGAAEGIPCAADGECASGLCVGGLCARTCPESGCGVGRSCAFLGDARVCVPTCVAGNLACPPDLYCVVDAAEGLMCRGPRDGRAAGGECQTEMDCAAEAPVCRQGRCRALCDQDAACPEETRCRVLPSGVRICAPRGDAELMAACAADADCADGLCEGGRCYGACGPGCADTALCVDAARQPAAPDFRCARGCIASDACPAGTLCRLDASGRGACY